MQYERQITIALFILIITGVLTAPLSILSDLLFNLIYGITQLPF